MTIQEKSIPKEILVTSIMILVKGSLLLAGFLYLIFGLNMQFNFLFLFIQPISYILAIINLIISISLFATCYGLVRKEQWSRAIVIKFAFAGIVIALGNIIFYVLIFNDPKNIMTILFSIVIGCSIVNIYLLYRSDMKAYFNRLKRLENERDNEIDNSLSLLSSDTLTLYLKIFLIVGIFIPFITAFVSLVETTNPEQQAVPIIGTIISISDQLVFVGVTIFLIWWFSRTYTNLKGLGISGLNFSIKRIILSFIIPVLNFFEPVRLFKTLWKASEPNAKINGISWKNVAAPAGIGVWWFFVIVSLLGEVQFFGTGSEVLGSIFELILVPIASISTIVIVRRINSRVNKKRELVGDICYWNPVEKVRIQHPADWDRYVKDNAVTLSPSNVKKSNKYSLQVRMSIEYVPNTNTDTYVNNTVNNYKTLFTDFTIININTKTILAGHRAFQIEYQYRLGNRIIKNLEVGAIIDSKIYRMEFRAESEQFLTKSDTVKKIIDSFELKNINN